MEFSKSCVSLLNLWPVNFWVTLPCFLDCGFVPCNPCPVRYLLFPAFFSWVLCKVACIYLNYSNPRQRFGKVGNFFVCFCNVDYFST